MPTYIYKSFEPGVWTVGYHAPSGLWEPESDHGSPDEAADRVIELNGGTPRSQQAEVPAAVAENLASLNELLAEVVQAIAAHGWTDDEFAQTARGVLCAASHRLGFEFSGRPVGQPEHVHTNALPCGEGCPAHPANA